MMGATAALKASPPASRDGTFRCPISSNLAVSSVPPSDGWTESSTSGNAKPRKA